MSHPKLSKSKSLEMNLISSSRDAISRVLSKDLDRTCHRFLSNNPVAGTNKNKTAAKSQKFTEIFETYMGNTTVRIHKTKRKYKHLLFHKGNLKNAYSNMRSKFKRLKAKENNLIRYKKDLKNLETKLKEVLLYNDRLKKVNNKSIDKAMSDLKLQLNLLTS